MEGTGKAPRKTPATGGAAAPAKSRRRVLIVDDHPILRLGARQVIESQASLVVCGEADTVRDARAAIRDLAPDVVLADISLRQGDGIELLREIRAHHPKLPVLVFSSHDETIYAERLLAAGANGYLMKHASPDQVIAALQRVLSGGIYVSEAVSNSMLQKFASDGAYSAANPIDRLSNREVQILHMIGKGMSTREIALSLNLSVKTIESHRQRVKRKLNLGNATQLMQCAVNWFSNASREAQILLPEVPRPRGKG
jgi:DNA-binding NarL/FixJ family response regulator